MNLEDGVKKYLGVDEYAGAENPCRYDAFFLESLTKEYGIEVVAEKIQAIERRYRPEWRK